MKRPFVLLLTAMALVIAFNILTRESAPVIALDVIGLSADGPTSTVMNALLKPGAYVLWYLGFDPDSRAEIIAAVLISWWAWLTALRIAWCTAGRAFGIVNMADYHRWLIFALPWRAVYRRWLRVSLWFKQLRYGPEATGGWTGLLPAMTLVFKRGDCIYLGRLWAFGFRLFQTLGLGGQRHVNVVAAPGSGKTRWLMAWLGMLHKNASAFVIDCDGQIINALGRALQRAGHPIINLDPFGLSHFPGASWNALDELTRCAVRHGRESVVRFALTLAEGLIREDNNQQPIFANAARNFIHGLILYVWLFEEEWSRNLVRLRDLLTRGLPDLVTKEDPDGFQALLTRMRQATSLKDDGCNGQITAVIARAASVMQSGQRAKEGNPFRSTAIAQTAFLDLPEIAAISRRSSFSCEDLKTGNPCVFICAPVTDIQTKLSGWVRALTTMTAYAFQNMPGDRLNKIPCSFLIDEAPSLGRIEILETASAVFRHFGIRLVMVMQDLGQLKKAYPQSWESFIGNAECTLWMGTSHQFTLEYLCKILGTRTRTTKVSGGPLSKVPARMEKREHPVLYPHQAAEFLGPGRGQFIVTRASGPALRISYDGYDTALPVTAYEPDENYKEKRLRSFTRSVIAWLWIRRPQAHQTGS